MARKAKGAKHISAAQAADLLGVDPKTIKLWVEKGRLRGAIKQVVREVVTVDRSSLGRAFDVQCLWCHKVFESKHPEQAKYCCREHKDSYRYYKEHKRGPR